MGKRSTISHPEYLAPVPERRARSVAATSIASSYSVCCYDLVITIDIEIDF